MSAEPADPLREVRLPGGVLRVAGRMTPAQRVELVRQWNARGGADAPVFAVPGGGGQVLAPVEATMAELRALMAQFSGARARARGYRAALDDAAAASPHAPVAARSALIERDGAALAAAEDEVRELRVELAAAHAAAARHHPRSMHSPHVELALAGDNEEKWRRRVEVAAGEPGRIEARCRRAGLVLSGVTVAGMAAAFVYVSAYGWSSGLLWGGLAALVAVLGLVWLLAAEARTKVRWAAERIDAELVHYTGAVNRLTLAEAGALAAGVSVVVRSVELTDETRPLP